MTKKTFKLFLASSFLTVLSFTSCVLKQPEVKTERTVSVNALGEVKAKNDRASISFSVTSRNGDALRAVEENTKKTSAVIKAITDIGLKNDSVTADRYSIHQESNYINGRNVPGLFVVSNSIIIDVADISKVGTLIDAAVKNGATSLSSLNYYVSSPEESLKEARILAVKNAEKIANTLATASGATLGQVLKIDAKNSTGFSVENTVARYDAKAVVAEEAMSASPGDSTIRVSISAVYKLE